MPENRAGTFTESHLPSFKLYEMLNMHPSDLVNVEYCKTFSTTKYGTNGQIKKLCKAYINYLVKKERIRSKPQFKEMNCNILTYWLYNKLSRTYHMDRTNCFNALSDINDMWILGTKFVTDSKACSCKPYLKITSYHDNWDHAKKLFDYSMDFNYLRDMKNNFKEKCDKLCTYLSEIADIYKKYKDVCILKNEHMCPVWGIEYEKYNPEDFLDMFKCRDDVEKPVTIEQVDSEEELEEEAEKEVEEVLSVHDGSSDTPLNIMDYQQAYEIKKDELKPLSTF
ncbi:variable surface protein, partial [Plasmodium gonderi]